MTFNDLFSAFDVWCVSTVLTVVFPWEGYRRCSLTVGEIVLKYGCYKVIRFRVGKVELRPYD